MGSADADEVTGAADPARTATAASPPPPSPPVTSAPPAAPASRSARQVYEDILRFGPRPRTDLAQRLGLSGTTLTRVTRSLLEDGLLRELDPRAPSKGRPQQPLDIDEDHAHFIGVKILPDSVLAAVVTARGIVREEIERPLAVHDPDGVLEATVEVCDALAGAHPRVAGIGVGLGGRADAEGTVVSSRMLEWQHPVPLGAQLQHRLELPVTITNDFRGLLHGLNWFEVGRRHSSFVLLTIGQGVAVGVVIGGRALDGRTHSAGLARSLHSVDRSGHGVLLDETVTTRAVLAAARDRGVLAADADLSELLAGIRTGDADARDIAAEVSHVVQVAAAGVIGMIDPGALVLGGESVELLGRREDFVAHLCERLDPQQRDVEVRMLPPDFDDWARGAAAVALHRFISGR